MVFMMLQEAGLIKEIKAATKKYQEAAQRFKDPEERAAALASPHLHAWNAILKYAEAHLGDEVKSAVQQYLKLVLEQAGNDQRKAMDIYGRTVRTIRLAKAFESTKIKLEVGIMYGSPSDTIWNIIKTELVRRRIARELPGTAPPGHMEDQLQTVLESLGVSSGKGSGKGKDRDREW